MGGRGKIGMKKKYICGKCSKTIAYNQTIEGTDVDTGKKYNLCIPCYNKDAKIKVREKD